MKPILPVPIDKVRSIQRAIRRWGLWILVAELARRPRSMAGILRRFKRLLRAADILFKDSKIMQFTEQLGKPCYKFDLYIPRWPSTAAKMRVQRAVRSDTLCPEQITLSITDRCLYKCPHCSNTRAPSKPMPRSRLLELVREIQDLGGSWLNIGGGEPGLVFERALAVVAAAGTQSETYLNTTGVNLDYDKAKLFKDAGLFAGRVSIHSPKPAEHDAFVLYPGAFKIAAEAIQTFRRADIFPVLSAAIPEEQITKEKVRDFMRLGKDLGVGFVEVFAIRPAGRALIACTHSELKRHDVDQQMLKKSNTDPRFADCPAVRSGAYLETPDRFGCVAGSVRLYISASGDVQPCPLINLSLGNVLDASLAAICRRMRSLLPSPRTELLCCQLQPAVSDYIAEHNQGCAVLPIPPATSTKILACLAVSKTPEAWEL